VNDPFFALFVDGFSNTADILGQLVTRLSQSLLAIKLESTPALSVYISERSVI